MAAEKIQEKNVAATAKKKLQKSYFDVLGLCCSSEVPLIENILRPLDGVKDVSVIVPSRTVIVVHDHLLISQLQIVKALNQARLEANVRLYGETSYTKKWPSPYAIICGILLLLSLFKYIYHPFQWLAIGAVAVGILPIAWRGMIAIRNLTLDINILALIAVIGTICLKDYLEAGTIVFLFTTAEWLESRASHKATAVMSTLMEMTPQKAVVADTGEVVDADEVKVNTILAVKAGEVIPIDGIVVEGKSEVDESTLTGESFPVPKQNDSNVWAGTINLNGYISVRTTALAEDCVVARMAKLVEEAQNSKSKTQRFIDRCAKYYTPGVLCISVGLAVIPAALRVHNENHWFHLALVVLVSACPCALILSTPVATFCALSKAATSGLLIKGGDYLETLSKIKIMAFDKTGTITRGEFVVTDFRSLHSDISFNTLLYWVSSIESKSSHPMATALVDYGRSHSIEPKPEIVEEFQNFPGEGIHGKIDGKDIYVGNRRIAQRSRCQIVPKLEGDAEVGQTIGYIYIGETPAGIFSLSDACRSGVVEAIKELKSLGIKTAMLTGDSNAAAMHAQNQLGNALDLVHAELLPEDKASLIENFKKEGPTAMIGDGINDAPALAIADIGISMGISGSALATETGHVILMTNDMRKIPKAIKLARRCHRKVIENVFLSVTTKVAIIALAIAGHPLIWAAVLADVGTCLLVIFNSMLLLRDTKRHKHGGKSCSTTHVHKHGGRSSCQSSHQTPHVHKHGCIDNGGRSSCHVSHVDKQHSSCSEGKNNKCESKSTNCCSKQSGVVTCVVEVHNVHNNNHLDHSDKNCHGEKNHHIEEDGHKHCHGEKNHHIEEGNHKHCHGEKNHHIEEGDHKHCHGEKNHQIEEGNHKHCHGEKNHHIEEGDHKHCHGEKNHHIEEGNHKHCHSEKNHHIEEGDHKHCHGEKNHHIEEGDHKHCHGEKNHHIEEGDHKHCHGEKNHHIEEGNHKHCHGEKNHHHIEEDVHKHCHGEKNHVEGDHHIGESHDMVEEPSCGSKSADLHGCCRSLEKREIGGGGGCCRKSFRKECCGKNGHFGNGFGPGLSEIVIE